MENSSAAKSDAKSKAALAQGEYETEEEAKAILARQIATTKVESVRGPPGAPIGFGVHKLSVEGGNPYAAKQMYRADEPVRGIQHQPVLLPADFYRGEAKPVEQLDPEMQYRKEAGERGVKAEDAKIGDLVAAGMTAGPKFTSTNA
jgi:hypothetical protein